MGTGASVLALNPTRRLEMAMDVAYRRQAPPYVAPQRMSQPGPPMDVCHYPLRCHVV